MSCLRCGASLYVPYGAFCDECREKNHEEYHQRTEEVLYGKEQQHLMGNEEVDDF